MRIDGGGNVGFGTIGPAALGDFTRSTDGAAIATSYGSGSTQVATANIKVMKVIKIHTSDLFDAVATTDSVIVWTQPAGSVLLGIKMKLATQFAATGMTDLDVTIGLAGDVDGLVAATMNLTSDAAATEYITRGAYWNTSALGAFWYAAAATDWVAYATAVGANLSTTSAGQLDFYATYLEL